MIGVELGGRSWCKTRENCWHPNGVRNACSGTGACAESAAAGEPFVEVLPMDPPREWLPLEEFCLCDVELSGFRRLSLSCRATPDLMQCATITAFYNAGTLRGLCRAWCSAF